MQDSPRREPARRSPSAELEAAIGRLRELERALAAVTGEREAMRTELEATRAELERFTYTVSHDLRSPLVTIKGFLGMMRKDLETGRRDRLERDMQRIAAAAEAMDALLGDLLELSRVGRMAGGSGLVPLAEVLAEALERLSSMVVSSGLELEVVSSLPTVWGERERLVEVLQNLLENAIKYSTPRTRPRVEVGSRREGTHWLVFVSDHGVGLDPHHGERIFRLFEQLDPSKEGTGIGLALVKRIVEVHGGRIWVESDGPGHGATFYFTLSDREGEGARDPDRTAP